MERTTLLLSSFAFYRSIQLLALRESCPNEKDALRADVPNG